MTEPRLKLIAHLRQQIAAGNYANDAKLRCCVEKLTRDLTGRPESATLSPSEEAEREQRTD